MSDTDKKRYSRDLLTPEEEAEYEKLTTKKYIQRQLKSAANQDVYYNIALNVMSMYRYLPSALRRKPPKMPRKIDFYDIYEDDMPRLKAAYFGLIDALLKNNVIKINHKRLLIQTWEYGFPYVLGELKLSSFDYITPAVILIYRWVFALLQANITASDDYTDESDGFRAILYNCVDLLCEMHGFSAQEKEKLLEFVATEHFYQIRSAKELRNEFIATKKKRKNKKTAAILFAFVIILSLTIGANIVLRNQTVPMVVTVSARLTNQNNVGTDWKVNCSVQSAKKYKLKFNTKHNVFLYPGCLMKITAAIQETDVIDDYAKSSEYTFITIPNLFRGFKLTQKVSVKENRGKYAGSVAHWEITYTFKPAHQTSSYSDLEYTSLLQKYQALQSEHSIVKSSIETLRNELNALKNKNSTSKTAEDFLKNYLSQKKTEENANQPAEQPEYTFGIGSTQDEVKKAMGRAPDKIDDYKIIGHIDWYYGTSKIEFDENYLVRAWSTGNTKLPLH